jgi:hypothetical protein
MQPEDLAKAIDSINERLMRIETRLDQLPSDVGQPDLPCQSPTSEDGDAQISQLEASFAESLGYRLDEVYTVAVGQESLRKWGRKSMMIFFSTTREGGTDFYLHVEGVTGSYPPRRYRIFQGQAHIFASGQGGLGPYVLKDGGVRKIYIQNGQHGTVTVAIYVPT